MKFLVDELPYYNEFCHFYGACCQSGSQACPKTWDKYKVCSKNNPHECELLIELQALEVLPEHDK